MRQPARHDVIYHTNIFLDGGSISHPDELVGPRSDAAWSEDELPAAAPAAAAGVPHAPAVKKVAAGKCAAVPAGRASEPHPNGCPWWHAMHDEFVATVEVHD